MKRAFPFLLFFLTVLLLVAYLQKSPVAPSQNLSVKTVSSSAQNTTEKSQANFAEQDTVQTNETQTNQALEKNEPNSSEPVISQEVGLHEKISHFYLKIPRKSSLALLTPSALHDTPAPVIEAGNNLADMHEYFMSHPHEAAVELNFYLKCSQQKDFFDSARALCAARASQLFLKMTGHKISSQIFDDRIAALKDQISL